MTDPVTHVFTGFDSAWTDNPKQPGALAHIARLKSGRLIFMAPTPATFTRAAAEIARVSATSPFHLVGIDQPTIVPNKEGSRPIDKVAASVISRLKGGVQPANRGRAKMFGDAAPIWPFLEGLPHPQIPMDAIGARSGRFLMEVFPALALPALSAVFAQRLPKYNPANRSMFAPCDWRAVCDTLGKWARWNEVAGMAEWAVHQRVSAPTKADQDAVDAAICALVAQSWWDVGTESGLVIGQPDSGYIVTPVSPATRQVLADAAGRHGVGVNMRWPASAVWRNEALGAGADTGDARKVRRAAVRPSRSRAPVLASEAPNASSIRVGRLTVSEIRPELEALAAKGRCITYSDLLTRFGLRCHQGTVGMLTRVLDRMGEEDAEAGRPLLAALVVAKASGLPGKGYYRLAGYPHEIPPEEMRRVHRAEMERLRAYYGQTTPA